ncbi:MAG: NlpC/P60 family protein [Actinomycetia bacterium]|nr:NlpC/P60 family protein [Actinomycetes bacterium]
MMPIACENEVLAPDNEIAATEDGQLAFDRRRFLGLAVAGLVGASAVGLLRPTPVYAVTSAQKQAEADEVKRKMDDWNEQLDKTSNDYYDAMDAHDSAVAAMEDAKKRAGEAIAREQQLQSSLSVRAEAMYKQGPLSFLDVVFGAHSFTEFTTSWDMLNDLNNRDVAMIEDCQQARQDAETAQIEYSTQEQIAQQKLSEAEEAKQKAEEIMQAYQEQLDSLNAEIARLVEQERQAEEERQRQIELQQQQAAQGIDPSGYVPYEGQKFSSIVSAAMSRLGCPYIWAASGPNAFDCSGLTSWCYKQVGIIIPRGGNAQYYSAPMKLSVADAQPGDLLFKPGHIGLCIGGGQFIHAPHPGAVVCIRTIAGYGWVAAGRW